MITHNWINATLEPVPKDGTEVLVVQTMGDFRQIHLATWVDFEDWEEGAMEIAGGPFFFSAKFASHWMYKPALPELQEGPNSAKS